MIRCLVMFVIWSLLGCEAAASDHGFAANSRPPVIACDIMSMSIEDKFEVGAAGTLGILVAWFAPKFPGEVGVVAWLLYLAFIYALGVFKLRRKRGNKMSLLTVLLIGWGFITLMSVIVWYGFKPNAEPAVTSDKDRSTLVIPRSAGPVAVSMSPLRYCQ